MIDTALMHDVGQLIGFAVQPNLRTATNLEYRRLVDQYRMNSNFSSAADAILTGMGLTVLSVDELGVIVAPNRTSPFAFRLTDALDALRANQEQRLVCGLALLGVAAYGYPTPNDLEDATVRYVDVRGVDELLRSAFAELAAALERDPDADEFGMDEAWRIYQRLSPVVPNRKTGKPTKDGTQYWINKVLEWLCDQGMARIADERGGHRYRLTERFRVHVRELAAHAAYEYLTEHAERDAAAENGDET